MAEKDQPYAYLVWLCSKCHGMPIEDRDHQLSTDLRCETCGHQFRSNWATGFAERVPGPEDEDWTGGSN